MYESQADTTMFSQLLDRLRAGDTSARNELINVACARLTRLARKMLRAYPTVARWEQTDDVVQNAALRLHRALNEVTPDSPASFFNLAAVQIRRELIDLARHHYGARGPGKLHDTIGGDSRPRQGIDGLADGTNEPTRLADWTEFHRLVETLPDELREVFNLVWYQGLTQADTAKILGVTERVVKWRWRSARLALHQALKGESPE